LKSFIGQEIREGELIALTVGDFNLKKRTLKISKSLQRIKGEDVKVPHDSVMSELRRIAEEMDTDDENLAMALAVYLLGFSTYNGFSKVAGNVVDDVDENALKRIYKYAKRIVAINE